MGVVKDMISRPLKFEEQNGCLKIFIRCVLGIDAHGFLSLQSFLTNKNGTIPQFPIY